MVTRRSNPVWRGSLIFLLALVSSTGLGATNSAWFARVWQSEDGLPENNVTGLAQSADGYLWISSHNGLVRFDGVQFERIPLPLAAGRNQPLIRALLLGRSNEVWLANESIDWPGYDESAAGK